MNSNTFAPGIGSVTNVTNSVTATAAVNLPDGADEVMLFNTSATSIVYVTITQFDGVTPPAGVAPTVTTGIPVLPLTQLRLFVGKRGKVIRTIADAADGEIVIVPGNGR